MSDENTDTQKLAAVIQPESANHQLASAASELGAKAEAAIDSRAEERFIWVVICIVLFDAYVFTQMQNWAGAIVIGVIELVAIIVLARKCQVEEIAALLTGLLHRASDAADGHNKR